MKKINDEKENGNIMFLPGGETCGHYSMSKGGGTVAFGLKTKPNAFNRLFVKLLLGWEWIDDPKPGSGNKNPTINGVDALLYNA